MKKNPIFEPDPEAANGAETSAAAPAGSEQGEALSPGTKRKVRIAFLCVHNSCRSQMAEAMCRHLAGDVFDCYSAGTETKPRINSDAVRLMKERYGIDMEETQYSKLIWDIPEVDIVVKMGCNVICPVLPSKHEEDWGLDDPSEQSDEVFKQVIQAIEEKTLDLKNRYAE